MFKFALRPWWIVSHLMVIAIAVLFVNLGFWQLRRHDERADRNAAVIARTEAPPIDIADLVDDGDPAGLRYRRTTASGTYLPGADLLVDNRSYEGLPGAWVVTAMRLDDGAVVAVNRGFLSTSGGGVDVPSAPPGMVQVSGTAVEWDGSCGVRTDDAGTPVGAACLNRGAMETVAGEQVLDLVVQQSSSTPDDDAALLAVPLPELDSGTHRSYAVQWFLFTAIGLITYPLILRRAWRYRNADTAGADLAGT